MTSEEAMTAGEEAMARDPRNAPYGYFAGGSFALDHCRVFMWFESVGAMADHLLRAEPVLFGIEGEDLQAYKKAASTAFEHLKVSGFTDDGRAQLNAAAESGFVVEWWGTFEELTSGRTDFSQDLLERFADLDEETAYSSLPLDKMEEFIEFLREYGV